MFLLLASSLFVRLGFVSFSIFSVLNFWKSDGLLSYRAAYVVNYCISILSFSSPFSSVSSSFYFSSSKWYIHPQAPTLTILLSVILPPTSSSPSLCLYSTHVPYSLPSSLPPSLPPFLSRHSRRLLQRLIQILNQIRQALNPHRQPHKGIINPKRLPHFRRNRSMRHDRRGLRQ